MKNIFAITLAVTALAAAGCSTVNSVENAQKSGQRNMVADQRVITDSSLARKLAIVGVNSAVTEGGLLKAQVELENRTSSAHHFLYRFEWFDSSGMLVNTILSTPLPDQIEGRESKFISSIAPNPACKDFRLKLIAAD